MTHSLAWTWWLDGSSNIPKMWRFARSIRVGPYVATILGWRYVWSALTKDVGKLYTSIHLMLTVSSFSSALRLAEIATAFHLRQSLQVYSAVYRLMLRLPFPLYQSRLEDVQWRSPSDSPASMRTQGHTAVSILQNEYRNCDVYG